MMTARTVLATVALLAACAAGKASTTTAAAADTDASAARPDVNYRGDQAPGTAAAVQRGKIMYGACSGCHGKDGEGIVGMAPRLNSGAYLGIISNDFVRSTIVHGREGTNMIAWGEALAPTDVDAIVSYVRSWQTVDGITLDESELKGDVDRGSSLFGNNCARCHGDSGDGYSADGPGIGIGRKAFLDSASNGMLRAIIKYGKVETPMKPFNEDGSGPYGALSAEDIDSIIRFLREYAQ